MKSRIRSIVFFILISVTVYAVCNLISICAYSTVSSEAYCDCTIVLGAAASDSGVSKVYAERLNHAVVLFEENRIQRILVTGGLGAGNTKTDAEAAAEYLIACGIPEDVILEETASTITQENLENAAVIMTAEGLSSALIVSDPLHMKRAMLLAEDAGIEAYPSPTQTSAYKSLKTKVPFVAREAFFLHRVSLVQVLRIDRQNRRDRATGIDPARKHRIEFTREKAAWLQAKDIWNLFLSSCLSRRTLPIGR